MRQAADTPALQWVSIDVAANILGLSPQALRKAIERRAVRAQDGGTEATLDGLHARKLGRLWRVLLSDAWTSPAHRVASVASRGVRSTGSSRP